MRSMRTARLALVGACLAIVASTGGVAADKPSRGCADDFPLWTIEGFREYMNSAEYFASLPPEGQAIAPDILAIINSDAWLVGAEGLDKNGDGQLCIKQKTITRGHGYGWMWNAVDNTSNG